MKKTMLNLKGAHELSMIEQKNVTGGSRARKRKEDNDDCGGDGSYIFVNGNKVCCYVSPGQYIC